MRAGLAARAGMAGGGGRMEGGQDQSVCPTGLERGVGNLGSRVHITVGMTLPTEKC